MWRKEGADATVSSNQTKTQTNNDQVVQIRSSQSKNITKTSLQLKYFHQDFMKKGTNPKYLGVDVTYVSEQQVLDDLYLMESNKDIFIPVNQPEQHF